MDVTGYGAAPMSEWALAYAAKGVPVFPCGAQKKPRIKKCELCEEAGRLPGDAEYLACAATPRDGHGLYDGNVDPERIARWWSRWPNAMIGTPTAGHLVVDLDVDPDQPMRSWDWWCSVAEPNGWQPNDTLMVATPSTGVHIWWRQPRGAGVRNSASKVTPFVDIRADGGYAILPPSANHEGAYEWLNLEWDEGTSEIATAPPWLVDLCTRAQRPIRLVRASDIPLQAGHGTTYGLRALEAELGRLAVAHEGTRNDTLVRAAYRAGQLVSGDQLDAHHVADQLLAVALRIGLDEREAQGTIRSGMSAGARQPRRPA